MKTLLILAGLVVVTLSAPHHHRRYRHGDDSDKHKDVAEDLKTTEDQHAALKEIHPMEADDKMDHEDEDTDAEVPEEAENEEEVTEVEEEDNEEVTEVEEEDGEEEGEHSEDIMSTADEMAVNDDKEVQEDVEDVIVSSGDAEEDTAAEASDAEEGPVAEAEDSTDEAPQMEEVSVADDDDTVDGGAVVNVSESEGGGVVTKSFTASVTSKLKGPGTHRISSVAAFLEGSFDGKTIDLKSVKNEAIQVVE